MTAEEILSIHTDTFNRALKEQDYIALEGLYADDYMLVRPDGSVLNKQEVLQDLRTGAFGVISRTERTYSFEDDTRSARFRLQRHCQNLVCAFRARG
jgi:hypothetical protein